MLIDDTSLKDYLQSEDAYEKKRQRMKKQNIDDIINKQYIPTFMRNNYVKIESAPQPIDSMYHKMYYSIHKAIDATKFVLEYIKNVVMNK